ncbi:sigma-54-dependent transcriptional regulator [Pseudemcibacter aquimaris]|uniref:sigma-54-dependent transcriptional regulator n=1 Tax=Pseudemcibacter aquimaris TaxID=2857064 RepID=UPI0020129786|nr:sigma-54 dependent transcriptional regulator [Pseudemcibacter aquimaris]MCC3861276.1 sigma-54 dependent transcriptional regulator [Pseudemcibacter aquimaris]WDU58050.1 sigma-54 dependent transcriptional regulator [Pseudemcibacter aquimaris]
MEKRGSILIVDDDEDILVAGKLLLKPHFASVKTIEDPNRLPELLSKNTYDAILLDMNFGPGQSSGEEGFHWLSEIMKIDPQAVVIMITAHGGVNIAVEAMKMGATDFVSKPWQNEKVVATLSAAVKLRRTRNEAANLKRVNQTLVEERGGQEIIGSSDALKNIQSMIDRAAPTDANVIILGENGTGKELVARELHRKSKRSGEIFLSVDMGAISESLFDSELFGHKKGSFTDAKSDRVGRFQAASGGTLFLDEIGNLPLHMQTKLLTVLEQRQVTPVGANAPVDIDVRIIAATNLTAKELNDESRFRQDLLFRLNTVEINVPPLRERPGDIEEIANHYIEVYCRKYDKPHKKLSVDALSAIKEYNWPGNVRALRHAIERAIILSQGNEFSAGDFSLESHPDSAGEVANKLSIKTSSGTEEIELPDGNLNLERMEHVLIERSLKKHRYNISHAAKELGLTRAALYRRMEKYGF